jgi:hypothetical protein
VQWTPAAGDDRALIDPRKTDADAARKLGAEGTANPRACTQSIVIDVTLPCTNASAPLRLSLYLVDFARAGAQFAVEMRELHSLALAAPTQKVTSTNTTAAGVYLSYEATTSVRFRVMEITGDYPQSDADVFVSALFLDTQPQA